jgi:hypothetical protein
MKTTILALVFAATSALAAPVPLVLRSTGYSELIQPVELRHVAAVEAVAEIPATETEPGSPAVDAVPAKIVIRADYRLTPNVPVVDVELSGIRTVISPKSSPVFALEISLPESVFLAYYPGDGAALLAALSQAGAIVPNQSLADLIRQVAVQVVASGE